MELGNPGIPRTMAFVLAVPYHEMRTGEAHAATCTRTFLPDFQDGREAHNCFSAPAVAWASRLPVGTLLEAQRPDPR